MSHRQVVLVASAVVAAALLSGCTGLTPDALPTGTNQATSPSPTATPTLAALPQTRVPLTCAQLETPAGASALVNSSLSIRADELTPLTGFASIAGRQYGSIRCVWGGKLMTDDGYDQGVTISVAPDAAADYAADGSGLEGATGVVKNTAGDSSAYECGSAHDLNCTGNLLVGSYWATLYMNNAGSTSFTPADAKQRMQKLLSTVAAELKSKPAAGAPWMAPGKLPGFCTNTTNTTVVKSAFASPGLIARKAQRPDPDAWTLAQSGSGYASCDWEQKSASAPTPHGQVDEVNIALLDGGAWALPQLITAPPTVYYVGEFKPVTIPGTTGAIMACNNADCEAIMGIGSTAVDVSFGDDGPAHATSGLAALVAAISAS